MRKKKFISIILILSMITLIGCSSGRRDNFNALKEDLYNPTTVTDTPKTNNTKQEVKTEKTEVIEINDNENLSFGIISTTINSVNYTVTILGRYNKGADVKDIKILYMNRVNPFKYEIYPLRTPENAKYEYKLIKAVFPSNYVESKINGIATINGKECDPIEVPMDTIKNIAYKDSTNFIEYGLFSIGAYTYLYEGIENKGNNEYLIDFRNIDLKWTGTDEKYNGTFESLEIWAIQGKKDNEEQTVLNYDKSYECEPIAQKRDDFGGFCYDLKLPEGEDINNYIFLLQAKDGILQMFLPNGSINKG